LWGLCGPPTSSTLLLQAVVNERAQQQLDCTSSGTTSLQVLTLNAEKPDSG
jgi:hypothetical protein